MRVMKNGQRTGYKIGGVRMNYATVNCDKCKEDFEVKPKEKKVNKDISKLYFTCPHCGAEYLVHYNSKEIKAKQKLIRSVVEDVGKARKNNDDEKAQELFNRYLELKKKLEEDMDELQKKVEQDG